MITYYNITPKIDATLKLSKFKAATKITHAFRTKPKSSRRSLEVDPDLWHTCFVSPCRRVFFFFPFFSSGIRGSLTPKYPSNEKKRPNIWRKNKHAPFANGLTGAHRERAQNFMTYGVPKTAWASISDSSNHFLNSAWNSSYPRFFLRFFRGGETTWN